MATTRKSLMKNLIILAILFIFPGFNLFSQTITGEVTDENMDPLPGVTVHVKGTTTGTSTDNRGNFILHNIAPDAILVFSFIGYLDEEIAVSGRENISVSLMPSIEQLDEVVVIGYGTVRRRDLTGSVASVRAQELRDMPATSISQTITGRLAGVQITTSEGSPDAAVRIRVRGGGSITQDNSPLLIVDGFPVDNISNISPSVIESIDVLRDASSTAIYGARGANGVVIITTKSGREGRTMINYDFNTAIKVLSNKLDVFDPYEYTLYQYERSRGSFQERMTFERLFGSWDQLELYKTAEARDWQKEVFGRQAPTNNHNLSISGGSAENSFNLNLSDIRDEAIMVESGYSRTNVDFRFNQKASERLTFSFDTRYADTKIRGAGTSDGGTQTNNRLRHSILFRPVDGLSGVFDDYDIFFDDDEYRQSSGLVDPLTLAKDEYRVNHRMHTTLNGAMNLTIIPNLVFRGEFGYQLRNERRDRFDGLSSPNARRYGDRPVVIIQEIRNNTFRMANTLTYRRSRLGGMHDLTILAGQELLENSLHSFQEESRSFPVDITPEMAIGSMSLGDDHQRPQTYESEDKLLSFFSRVNYGLLDKYLASMTVRTDGSSKFGPDNRWSFFPSFSAGWRISGESFMDNSDILNNLMLRASYGEAGNNRIGDLRYTTQFSVGASKPYFLNNVSTSYFFPGWLANPLLMWETMVTRNLGLDFGMLGDRLQGTIDVYRNTGKNLLIASPIPSETGYTTQIQNIGQTTNSGVEFSLRSYIVEKSDFRLHANFNISFNKSRVDRIGRDGVDFFTIGSGWSNDVGNDFIVQTGQPVGLIYGFVTDGFYTVDDFSYDPATGTYTLLPGVADNRGITFAGFGPGAIKFKNLEHPLDSDGNAVIDDIVRFEEDQVVIGNTNPKHFGGFNIASDYRAFDFSIFFNWVYGNDIYNANKIEFSSGYQAYTNLSAQMNSNQRWRSVNDQGIVVTDPGELAELNRDASIWAPPRGRYLLHSWAVEDGSFLRINNITLGYTLPRSLTGRIAVSNLRVFFTINNLYTFTNYSGYDPEVDTRRSTPMTPGVDYSAYPRSRMFMTGINVSL
jgi:TonB-dependent starch-binding outer membrane protein SusC